MFVSQNLFHLVTMWDQPTDRKSGSRVPFLILCAYSWLSACLVRLHTLLYAWFECPLVLCACLVLRIPDSSLLFLMISPVVPILILVSGKTCNIGHTIIAAAALIYRQNLAMLSDNLAWRGLSLSLRVLQWRHSSRDLDDEVFREDSFREV